MITYTKPYKLCYYSVEDKNCIQADTKLLATHALNYLYTTNTSE